MTPPASPRPKTGLVLQVVLFASLAALFMLPGAFIVAGCATAPADLDANNAADAADNAATAVRNDYATAAAKVIAAQQAKTAASKAKDLAVKAAEDSKTAAKGKDAKAAAAAKKAALETKKAAEEAESAATNKANEAREAVNTAKTTQTTTENAIKLAKQTSNTAYAAWEEAKEKIMFKAYDRAKYAAIKAEQAITDALADFAKKTGQTANNSGGVEAVVTGILDDLGSIRNEIAQLIDFGTFIQGVPPVVVPPVVVPPGGPGPLPPGGPGPLPGVP